jgi:apolipoprotein N-acyltransferase
VTALSNGQAWFAALSPWPRRALIFVAGAVATLGHAPFMLAPLYLVALAALVIFLDVSATRPKRIWSAILTGFFFALGHFSTGLYWVSAAFNVDSSAWGPLWGVPATIALAAGMAIFWALGCGAAMTLWTNDARRLAWFVFCLTTTEWLRGNILSGFPWLLPGYIWTPGEPVSQLASIIGIYGVSLLTLAVAAALAQTLHPSIGAGRRFAPAIVAALAIGMAWGWGAQRLASARVDPPGALPIIRVADSGLSQAEKWEGRADQEWRVLRAYLAETGPPEDNAAAIVIWPEGAIPVVNFFMLENPEFMAAVGSALGDRVLITGLTRRQAASEGDVIYFNSAAVIDGVSGRARLSQIYDKHHLVPFGEYIPLWSLVSRLNIAPLQRIGAGFESGPRPSRIVVPGAPPAVVLICYEAIFPGLTPRGDGRPGWIVSITNDAWFGGGSGPYQHYVMARFRAIEEGLPLARAASGGISAIVDAYGQEVVATNARGGHAEAQLPPALGETPFAKWGFLSFPFLLVIIVLLRFVPRRKVSKGLRDE